MKTIKENSYIIYEDSGQTKRVKLSDNAVADYCHKKYGWVAIFVDDTFKQKRVQNALKERQW